MQAGGQGFESLILHERESYGAFREEFIDILTIYEKLVEKETFKSKISLFDKKNVAVSRKGYNFSEHKKLNKGTRRMPRLCKAKKDVISCEKLRGGANDP